MARVSVGYVIRRVSTIIFVIVLYFFMWGDDNNSTQQPQRNGSYSVATNQYRDTYAYDEDPPADYVTLVDLQCPDQLEGSHTTFTDVLNNVNQYDDSKAVIECDLLLSDGVENNNVRRSIILSQHGGAARRAKLKSFTITFLPEEKVWRGLDKLVLKKDPSDKSGLRSKILFDTFKEMPSFNSLRTNFMALKIQVRAKDGAVADHDFGMYINFEPVDESFVKRRNWLGKERYNLYKSVNWDGQSVGDLKLTSDPEFNDTLFRAIMDYEGSDDHTQLLHMMKDINEVSDTDFPQTLRKWFDLDNLSLWVACTHAILGDWDHTSNNMGLFTNDELKKFYFQPWDYDKSLRLSGGHSQMDTSMSSLNNHFLFRRILIALPVEFMGLVWEKVVILTADGAPFSEERMADKASRYASAIQAYTQPGTVDAIYISRKPWSEQEDDFFGYLHDNKRWWKFNSEIPTSVLQIPSHPKQIVDTGETFYVKLKAAISPVGLEVEHQIVLHTDYDPDVTHWYARPEKVIWRTAWMSFGRQMNYLALAFTIPQKIIARCRKDGPGNDCWVNTHARDSEGKWGYFAQKPLYVGVEKLFNSIEEAITWEELYLETGDEDD
ncbi:hypothetical protein SARC_01758 [Sphaeroforma arctica JP610]|uniref:Uncharacterized protein n=1 Tax=Sphaeroforma arctica JP610 TaxID=667725 RepID=A0A0L0GB29_9EUKA|nr:hypothetical protein SARC_01758 [Sphaeroforma arctica JP610]KNC86099.1 hypothetical protein SARC_01758 [Sphaeroforma arctica JP610]|eukprot:XP_014160001.1 hypothetical protein SARC_01758 [Sphaeroforma arctica JP610]